MSLDRRDERLRHSLLEAARHLGNRNPDGWVSGSKLALTARDREGHGVDGDAHAERLLADLLGWGLLAEKDPEPLGGADGAPEPRHRQFKLTAMGWQLLMARIDPIRGVYDRRAE